MPPFNNIVLLINPRATYANEIAQKCYPPMHLLYLAASLRDHGFEPRVVDANALRLADANIGETVREARPLAVGVPVYSDILPHARDLTRLARRNAPDAAIVLGGPHATAVPESTLSQFPDADYVLTGEAEESLVELCLWLRRKQTERPGTGDGAGTGPEGAPASPASVPGLHYRGGGRIVSGGAHRLPYINALPLPDRDLVAECYRRKLYYSLMVRQRPVDTLFSSRGCPFHCGFCYNFRFAYRGRSPESVVHEIALIRERGIRDIEICDDNFTVDEERALRIFELIIRERLGISFRIKSRVDVFTERLAAKAREAGVYLAAFGMESGSQRILDSMNKGITLEQGARACALTRKHGILCHSSWIVGYPGETPDTVEETYRFIMKHRPSTVNIAVLRPYPNTPVYRLARQQGTLEGEWSPDMEEAPWVRLPWAPDRETIAAVVRKLTRKVYFTPRYAWEFGRSIASGANWLLARYALQEMGRLLRH